MHREQPLVTFLHALRLHRGRSRGRLGRVEPAEGEKLHQIFQVSTLNAVMEGVYDGVLSVGELRRHGDFGLGTFNALDGEMVAVDGAFYQLRADGSATIVDDETMRTPFAVVQFFQPEWRERVDGSLDIEQLPDPLRRWAGSDNYFFAVRIDGRFERVVARSVPRQSKPYPPLVEVTRHQTVFELADVAGTMVGFRFPDFVRGINMPGFHLHFLSDDRSRGGHVLEFVLSSGVITADHTAEFFLELPESTGFGEADLAKDQSEAIAQAEGLTD